MSDSTSGDIESGIAELIAALTRPVLSTRFASLPNEIQLQILAHLPAKEIQRARRIDKHTRDLIDEPSNATLLCTRGHARERARLQADVDYCMDYSNITFLEALRRYCERRGIWPDDRGHFYRIIDVFVHLWASQHNQVSPDYFHDLADARPLFRKFAFTLLHIHLVSFIAGAAQRPEVLPIMARSRRFFTHNPQNPLATSINSWAEDVEERAIFHKAPVAPTPGLAIPRWPLTQLVYVDQDKPEPEKLEIVSYGICGDTSLAELLDIPYLPNYSNSSFAYCVHSQQAYDIVKKGRKTRELTGVEKLAVVEETFLF